MRTVSLSAVARIRVVATVFALLALVFLLDVPAAHAGGYAGTGASFSYGTPGAGNGGGGGGGNVPYWEITNSEATINWGETAANDGYSFGGPSGWCTGLCKVMSNQRKAAGVGSGTSNAEAIVSKAVAKQIAFQNVPGTDPNWGYHVHSVPPPGPGLSFVGDKAIQGWSIKIWREGESHPFFERRFCDNNAAHGAGTVTDAYDGLSNYNTRWVNCGSTTSSGDFAHNGSMASRPNRDLYGMLGWASSADKALCTANLNPTNSPSGPAHNGNRNSKGQVVGGGVAGPRVPTSSESAVPSVRRLALANKNNAGTSCYWEGSQLGQYSYGSPRYVRPGLSGATGEYNPYGPRVDQFGYNSKGQKDLSSAGLKEAVFLHWNMQGGVTQLFYAIDGVPNDWYVVQIASINDKQKLMPGVFTVNGKTWDNYGNINSPQFIRAYVPNHSWGRTCTPAECSPPCAPPDPQCTPPKNGGLPVLVGEPKPTVALDVQSPVQVREQATEVVSLVNNTPLTEQQGVFPITAALQQMTPQSAYNGLASPGSSTPTPSYASNYVTQDADMGIRLPTTGGPASRAHGGQEAFLPQTPALTNLSTNAGAVSQNAYDTTWLQPTMTNPCYAQINSYGGLGGNGNPDPQLAWPSSPGVCASNPNAKPGAQQANTVNAWDDYVSAAMTWEDVWVAQQSSQPAYGYITNQLLRCNAPVDQVVTSSDSCPQNYYGLAAVRKGYQTQYAQGYLTVNNPRGDAANATAADQANSAAARVMLHTSADSTINQMAMWDRVSGTVQGNPNYLSTTPGHEYSNTKQPVTNTRTSMKELNFCQQGLPAGTHIYRSSTNPSKDSAVKAAQHGDPNCGGFAVHWQWSQNSHATVGSPNAAGDCNVNTQNGPAPKAVSYPAPTAATLNPTTQAYDASATALVASWGVYGQEYAGSLPAYGTASWSADRVLPGGKTPPYRGQRPGAGYATQHCNAVVTGKWKVGHWQRSWVFTTRNVDSNPSRNCQFVQTTDLTPPPTVIRNDLAAPESHRPSGAPAGTASNCAPPAGNLAATTGTHTNHAPDNGNPPAQNFYHLVGGPYSRATCPANDAANNTYYNCTKVKNGKTVTYTVQKFSVWSKYAYKNDHYAFGYWHWDYRWVWGTSEAEYAAHQAPNPYECATSGTPASRSTIYSGPLINKGQYGWTKFVYSYGAATQDPNEPGNDTKYVANNPYVWVGTTYNDGGTTYGSTIPNSPQNCTVLRHGGWVTSGAWGVSQNPSQNLVPGAGAANAPGTFSDGTAETFAGAGWGANNTAARVPNGQYNIQYTFDNLSLSSLSSPSPYCAHAMRNSSAPIPQYCWSLWADYDGRSDYQWSHAVRANDPNTPTSSSQVTVYGQRNTR